MSTSPPPKTPRRRADSGQQVRQLSGMQILFVSILAIGLLLAINFSSRITAGQQIENERELVEMEIATLEAEQITLRQELEHVRSDRYVEQWAHAEGKMVRAGEVLIVPVPAGAPLPTPTQTPQPVEVLFDDAEPEMAPWRLWWALFFDGDPPF